MSNHIGAKCLDCDDESAYWFRGLDPKPVREFLSLGTEAVMLQRAVEKVNSTGLIEFSIDIIGRTVSGPYNDGLPGKFLIKHMGHHVVVCDEYGRTE